MPQNQLKNYKSKHTCSTGVAIDEFLCRYSLEVMYLQREPIFITTVADVSYILDGHHRINVFSDMGKNLTVTELSNTKALEMFKSKMQQINKGLFK